MFGRHQFWVFLSLGLALGMFLEILKSPPTTVPVRLAGFSQFETLLEEGKETVADEPKAPKQAHRRNEEPIAPRQLSPEEMNMVVAEPTATPAPTPKPETAEEKKKREEEEKKKKLKEKKRKIKEKRRLIEEQRRLKAEAEAKAKENEAPAENEAANNTGSDAPPVFGGPMRAFDQFEPKSAQEWEAFLLKEIDPERVKRFVKLYQTGIVKKDIFFPVIEAMLEDPRPRMRQLAINALGAANSSQSFEMLIHTRQTDAEKSNRELAARYLRNYGSANLFAVLNEVISASSDSDAVYEALQLVKAAAEDSLKGSKGAPPATTGVQASSLTASWIRMYSPFVSSIQRTIRQSNNGNIKYMGSQALAAINSLITPQSANGTPSP